MVLAEAVPLGNPLGSDGNEVGDGGVGNCGSAEAVVGRAERSADGDGSVGCPFAHNTDAIASAPSNIERCIATSPPLAIVCVGSRSVD